MSKAEGASGTLRVRRWAKENGMQPLKGSRRWCFFVDEQVVKQTVSRCSKGPPEAGEL